MFLLIFEMAHRTLSLWLKSVRRVFKHTEPSNPFLKTVKIFSAPLNTHLEFKLTLDTGCDINLISADTVHELSMSKDIQQQPETIGVCLNGGELSSIGTITLRWKGKGKFFRRIFTTKFYVIEGDSCPWQVILGSGTIIKYSILMVAGFGKGRVLVLPKETKKEKKDGLKRREEFKQKGAANDMERNADIRQRENAREQLAIDISSSSKSQGSRKE